MAGAPTLQQIDAVVAPALAAAGYELVQACYADGTATLRLTIDKLALAEAIAPPPDATDASPDVQSQGGVTLDDCTHASQLADRALEDAGFNAAVGHANLEVSSPGLERPLTKPGHFRRFVGQPVRLQLVADALPARQRRLRAQLVAADAEGIDVMADTQALRLRYDQIVHANLIYEPFAKKRAPKPALRPRPGTKE